MRHASTFFLIQPGDVVASLLTHKICNQVAFHAHVRPHLIDFQTITMSSAALQIFTKSTVSRSTIFMTGAAALGFVSLMDHSKPKTQAMSLESQFGTSDGYFPTATKGALLSKLPGNKDHMVGAGYVALGQRKSSDRRGMDQRHN
jgi:hypothetical protein